MSIVSLIKTLRFTNRTIFRNNSKLSLKRTILFATIRYKFPRSSLRFINRTAIYRIKCKLSMIQSVVLLNNIISSVIDSSIFTSFLIHSLSSVLFVFSLKMFKDRINQGYRNRQHKFVIFHASNLNKLKICLAQIEICISTLQMNVLIKCDSRVCAHS